jgi:hypothetical protein
MGASSGHITNLKQSILETFIYGNSTFFIFSLSTEGATKKAWQFIMLQKFIYDKNSGFIKQKCVS